MPPDPPGGGAGDGDDDDAFRRAMQGVKPIERRAVARAARRPVRAGRPAGAAAAVEFAIDDDGETIRARMPGMSLRALGELCREFATEVEIDLHRMTSVAAREALLAGLRAALLSGQRSVLIIHGRGTHSEHGESVLRAVAVEVLSRSAMSESVRAFATAGRKHGGTGALYVFLRAPAP